MVFMDMLWKSPQQRMWWESECCPARGCHLAFYWGLPGWRWQRPEPGMSRLYVHWHGGGDPWPWEPSTTEAVLEVPRCGISDFHNDPAWAFEALYLILDWVARVHGYEDWLAGKVPDLPGCATHDATFVTDLNAGDVQDAAR